MIAAFCFIPFCGHINKHGPCLVLFQYCPTPLKGANRTGVGAQIDVSCVGRNFISYCWSCLVTAALKLALSSIDVIDSGREFQSVIVLGVKAYLKQFLLVDIGIKLLAAGELCLRFLSTGRRSVCSVTARWPATAWWNVVRRFTFLLSVSSSQLSSFFIAAFSAIIPSDESSSPILNGFQLIDEGLGMGIPHWRAIIKYGSDQSLVGHVFNMRRTRIQIST